jgi:hypothetical protein
MKFHLILIAAVALPQVAAADVSGSHEALGTMQATMDFCVKVSPRVAERFHEQAGSAMQVPGEELAAVQSDPGYKEAYASTRAALEQSAAQEAIEVCNGLLDADK